MNTINWSPTTAIFENGSPTTVITGSPGSGKSFFLLNVAANQLIMGQKVIYIDPKNDAFALANVVPNIDIIDVNNISEGSLNPFTILKNCDVNKIMTLIECICGKLSDGQRIAITPIIKDFIIKKNRDKIYVDFITLANYLYANDNDEARAIGTMLKSTENSKYGKLIFSNRKDIEPISLDSDRLLVISLHGMQLPSYTKNISDYNADERFTSAIIYLICSMLNETLTKNNKIPVNLIIDEAHILFSNNEMRQIIHNLMALGRSLNIATILASQGVSHFPKEVANYSSTKIMFRMSIDETKKFLDMFDTSDLNSGRSFDRNSIVSYITNIKDPGYMFMIDRLGRGGFGKVVSNFPDSSILTSNPLLKKNKR